MKRKTKKIIAISLISFLLVSFISCETINTANKNKKINQMVNEFKNESTFSFSYDIFDFYKVNNNTSYNSNTFSYIGNQLYVGTNGDILTCLRNEYDSKLFSDVFSFYFGGHACIVIDGKQFIETTGKSAKGENVVKYHENNWLYDNTRRKNFIALKVKCDETVKEKAVDNAINKLGIPYNFLFLFNTKNKYYCTDLVTRSYQEASDSIDLCKKEMIISVQDIILSNDVYISIYKEKNLKLDTQGLYNIYYLDDGIDYASLLD